MTLSDRMVAPALLDRLAPLLPELEARAGEMETQRRLPRDLALRLAGTGVFRMVTPEVFGGLEASPAEIIDVIGVVSQANASAGWCVMIAATTALNAAFMAPGHAREIYSDPLVITGGVFAPMGRADVEGEHYRVSGRWQWGSGSANCTWLCGGCTIWEDGEMRRLPSGAPDTRMMVFPASSAILHDTWHVMGLKGTGSGDIEVQDILVPRERSVSLVSDRPVQEGALYKFPVFGLLALGVCAVALGNARAALDAFHELAVRKGSQGSARTLSERAGIQAAAASAAADWRAARAYLVAETERVWAIARGPGPIPAEARRDLRMACTHVTRTSARICREMYDCAGGAALFESSRLQLCLRDAHAITQHIVTGPATWELLGRMLFGLPTDTGMV